MKFADDHLSGLCASFSGRAAGLCAFTRPMRSFTIRAIIENALDAAISPMNANLMRREADALHFSRSLAARISSRARLM